MSDVYKHSMSQLVYTEGVRWHAREAGAYWLIDLIASYQHDPLTVAQEFQVWKLLVNPDKSAMVWMTDGNSDTSIIAQKIEYTDYPSSECEWWCCRSDGVEPTLMTPDEY